MQLSQIETEKMLVCFVEEELRKRAEAGTYKGKFSAVCSHLGYQARSALPRLAYEKNPSGCLMSTSPALTTQTHTTPMMCTVLAVFERLVFFTAKEYSARINASMIAWSPPAWRAHLKKCLKRTLPYFTVLSSRGLAWPGSARLGLAWLACPRT